MLTHLIEEQQRPTENTSPSDYSSLLNTGSYITSQANCDRLTECLDLAYNKIMKIKRFTLIAVIIAGILLPGCSIPLALQNPLSPSSAPALSEDVLSQLVSLTNNADPGPTKDYYWSNGAANINEEAMPTSGNVAFEFDSAGRSSTADASLTYQMFAGSAGSRQGSPLDPPFWPHNLQVAIYYSMTGKTYNGYVWNRSHSVADSLAGKQSYISAANFTAGTRPQNVGADQNGGMRAAEEIVENFWKSNPNSNTIVWYQTTPIYDGSEKIPRGSIVDILSSDNSINTEIVVINDAEGWTIDYSTGAVSQR